MINSVSGNVTPVEVPNQEQTQNRQYVTMRGNDYERTPDSDTYESSSNKTAKAVGIGAALLAIGATIYAGCHGKNILEKAGKETGFMENIKTGYKNFFKKAENAVKDAEKKVDETVGENLEKTKNKAKNAAENAEKGAPDTGANVLTEKDYYKEYEQELEQKRQKIAESDRKNEEWLSDQRKIKETEYIRVWQEGLKEKEAKELATFRQATDKEAREIVNEFNQNMKGHINSYLNIARKSENIGIKSFGKNELLEKYIPDERFPDVVKNDVLKVSKSTKNGTVEYYCDKDGKNIFQIKVLNKNDELDYFIELGKAGNRTTERFDQATICRKYNVKGNDRDYVYEVIFKDNQSELYSFNDMTNALAEQGYIKYINISSKDGKTLLQWSKLPPNDEGFTVLSEGKNGLSWIEL